MCFYADKKVGVDTILRTSTALGKQPVGGIVGLLTVDIAGRFHVTAKLLCCLALELYTDQDSTVGRTVIAVVEQTDVPTAGQALEEIQQRTGTFGKLETTAFLMCSLGRMTAHHVTYVQLGCFIVGKIDHLESLGGKMFDQLRTFHITIA